MKKVALIGYEGFVGSAIFKIFSSDKNVEITGINRKNFESYFGKKFDLLIESGCNSKKYLADDDPVNELEQSVVHRLITLTKFNADFHIHISSVDVYEDLSRKELTTEDSIIITSSSNYGSHKLLAESLVQHYADNWLIFRLSGMIGSGLRKNPVFDILNNSELYINQHSQYQYISTSFVANTIYKIYKLGINNEIFNVAGKGLISPYEIAALLKKEIKTSNRIQNLEPRIVDIDCNKISTYVDLPNSADEIKEFAKKLSKY